MGKPDIREFVGSADHEAKSKGADEVADINEVEVDPDEQPQQQAQYRAELALLSAAVHIRVPNLIPFLSMR